MKKLEVEIHQDVEHYQERAYLGLTARQAIFFYPALTVATIVTVLNLVKFHLDETILTIILIFIIFPPLAFGFIAPQGMTLEKFLHYLFNYYFKENKRPYLADNFTMEDDDVRQKTTTKKRQKDQTTNYHEWDEF